MESFVIFKKIKTKEKKTQLILINEFGKMVGYKINFQILVVSLCTWNKEFKNTM